MEVETETEEVVVVGTLEEVEQEHQEMMEAHHHDHEGIESVVETQEDVLITGDVVVDHQHDGNSIIFSESQLQESLIVSGEETVVEVEEATTTVHHHEMLGAGSITTTTTVDMGESSTTACSVPDDDVGMHDVNVNSNVDNIVVAVLQEVEELSGESVPMNQQETEQLQESLEEAVMDQSHQSVPGTSSEGGFEETATVGIVVEHVPAEQSAATTDGTEHVETVRPETPCNCLSCQEVETELEENSVKSLKLKCLICYASIISPVVFPVGGESSSGENASADDSFGRTVEQHIADILNADDISEVRNVTQVEHEPNEIVNEAASQHASISVNVPKDTDTAASCADQFQEIQDKLPGSGHEDSVIKLPIIFQILGCTIDDVDKEIESSVSGGILNQVPLCVSCQSVVSDAILVYKELQRLEKSLGALRESMKDQIVKSFEANYCTKKNRNEQEDAMTIQGQVDIVRRAIISEGVSAAKILSSFKGSKRGKRKKTVVSKSALYPQVSLGVEKKPRANKRARFDESGVKKEEMDLDYPQFEDDFAVDPGEPDEKEETTFLQTHSGRRVKKPNYRKWLLADEEDEEIEARPQELDVPVSPKSEPEWSPGHSDDEEADFDSDTETSGDSEIDSEEDRKDLDELGKLLDQGERFDDIETGKRVVRARRKKKQNSANPNRIKCTECPKTFADEAKKEIHFKRKHTPGGQAFQCEKCSKVFRRPGLLRKHLQKQHGEPTEAETGEDGDKKRHMCDFCGQKYRNASELRIHVRLHTGETPYKCEHCDKSFVSSLKREFHIEQSHWEIPPLKCDFCPKAFFRQHRLRIHRISHTGEKAYLCEICSQSFSHPTYLKYHQGQHAELNLETFKCKDCGKTFANPTNLRLHVKTVHLKQFRFTCEVCNMGFTHMSHKRIHMRGHTGERPYKCELCNESFRYRDRLRIHMRGHTGERPFVCEICKKGFASKSKLKRHEKIHEKNQPSKNPTNEEIEQAIRHRCDDCGKGFAEPQHLSAHRRYCQRKSGAASEKEEKKANRSNQNAKTRTVTIAGGTVAKQVEVVTTIPQVVTQAGTQQTMLVPLPVNYAYPVTYTYEVPQYTQQSGVVREYQYQN